MQNKRLLHHPGIQVLKRAIRREQYLQLASFSVMLAVGIACCCFAFHDNALITIAGLTFTILSISALYHLRQNWNDDRLMRLLEYQSLQIVWVYPVVVQHVPFGIHMFQNGTLFFKLINGDEISVVLPASKLKLVCRTLSRLLPHAAIGYSKERELQYRQNPRLLIRGEK